MVREGGRDRRQDRFSDVHRNIQIIGQVHISLVSNRYSNSSRQHCTIKSHPSLVWNTRQPNTGCFHWFLLYYPFFCYISLFYYTGETAAGYKPRVSTPIPNGQQRWKRQPLEVDVSQSLERGLRKKISNRSYISQYVRFPSFLFCTFVSNEDATYLFSTDPPWQQPPAHGTRPNSHPGLPSGH